MSDKYLSAGTTCFLLVIGLLASSSEARTGLAQRDQGAAGNGSGLTVIQLRPNFYMIGGAGGNIGVQIGINGAVVVDSGSGANAQSVVAAIKKIGPYPIRYVINTNADPDHVGGNAQVAQAGEGLLMNAGDAIQGVARGNAVNAAAIMAHENVLLRMSAPDGQSPAFPAAAWPTEPFHEPRKYFFLNGEGIEVLHQTAAHTDADSLVFFRRSDVIMAGDVLDTTRFPVIDLAKGGSIDGEIAALQRLVDMAISSIPIVAREDGTLIIAGHGRVCDQLDVVEYRDMIQIIRDRISDLMKAGKTLDQIKATNPTRGYTPRYGSNTGPWTTNNFVEAVYRSLMKEKS